MLQRELLTLILFSVFAIILSMDRDFDHFVLAQQWARSVCTDSEHSCVVPAVVKTWTVHGLWPTRGDTQDPINCNSSWVFNFTKIESLKANLSALWPNLYTDTSPTEFWAHEWTKHGTCATSVKATSDEYHYFSKAMQLNLMVNLDGALKRSGVVPDKDTGYSVKFVEELLNKYYTTNVTLSCVYDKQEKRQFLMQIEICLSKDFTFVHCHPDHSAAVKRLRGTYCRSEEPVYIMPMHDTLYFKSYHVKPV